jgi:hypothetical protein
MDIIHQPKEIKVIVKGNGNGNKQPLYYYESSELIRKVDLLLRDLMKKNLINGDMVVKVNQAVIKDFTNHSLEKDAFVVIDEASFERLLINPDSNEPTEDIKQ